jgi:hypothetical protein
MTGKNIRQIVSAIVGLALIGAAIYLVTIDRAEHVDTLIAIGIAALGIAGVVLPSPFGAKVDGASSSSEPPPRKPPTIPPMLVLVVALFVYGCADPIRDQAEGATVAAATITAGGDVVMAARDAALDRVEAQYPTDPEHDAQLELEAARWRPVLVALDAGREALLTWISALELAHAAGGGEGLLGPVISLGLRTLRLVSSAFELAAELGVEGLPSLPTLPGGL